MLFLSIRRFPVSRKKHPGMNVLNNLINYIYSDWKLKMNDEYTCIVYCLLYIVICSHIELLCPLICNSAQVKNRNALRCVWVWSRTGWSLQQQRLSFLMKSVWTWLCMNMYEHLVYPQLAIVRKSWTTNNNHWILGYLLFRQSHMFGRKMEVGPSEI